MAEHTITRAQPTHRRWDVRIPPVVTVSSGDSVIVETDDFTGGQIARDAVSADLLGLDFASIYPLAGPIAVEDAEPGDVLAVEFLGFEVPEWGWACILPGLGLLPPGEFDQPYLKVFDLTDGATTQLAPGVRIPIEPFCGTVGVPCAGMHDVAVPPPHAGGGNIDLRHLTAGTILYLPVGVPGGLLSLGDAHAAQGDGEVAISGIECAMQTTIRVSVERGHSLSAPALRRPAGSLTPASTPTGGMRPPVSNPIDGGFPFGGAVDDRPPRARTRPVARRRLHAVLAGRRPQDHRGGGLSQLDRRLLHARRRVR